MNTPQCEKFGACGGCSLQDQSYEDQLAGKRKLIAEAIGFPEEAISLHYDQPYGYRNRMDFIFGEQKIGQRMKGRWWETVELDRCPISNDRLNVLMQEVNAIAPEADAFDAKKKTGTFKNAVIRTPALSSSVTFVLNEESPLLKEAEALCRRFAEQTSAENVLIGYTPRKAGLVSWKNLR